MGVFKAFYCLLNSLILAKLYSDGLRSGSQKVLESYLSNIIKAQNLRTFKVLDLRSSKEYHKDQLSAHIY